ncbi:MAG TPA: hypothetical protein VGD67_02715 [Pseudonocardiaceae bacterium]
MTATVGRHVLLGALMADLAHALVLVAAFAVLLLVLRGLERL